MKKRIAFVGKDLAVGGIQSAFITLMKYFDLDKYDVSLWLMNDDCLAQRKLDPRISVHFWGKRDSKRVLLSQARSGDLFGLVKGAFYRVCARVNIGTYEKSHKYSILSMPLLSDLEYDVIIAYHGCWTGAMLTALYSLKGKERVFWVHSVHDFLQFYSGEYIKFNKVACVSKKSEEFFLKSYPSLKGKTAVIHNLIDTKEIIRFAQEAMIVGFGQPCILTVGRLSPEKGQQMVPRTIRLLLDAGYDIKWYLVGDGPTREEIEQEIEKYNVQDHVILLGTQTNPYPYMKNCTIYVQTSLSEGWCLTVQEARILQKPIVSTDLPVIHEQIVSGENGLIADGTTPEALFEGIKTLLDHPELQQKFIDNLSKESWDNSKELQKLYDFIES